MAELGKLWAGRIYGTNTGNFFLDLELNGEAVKGTLRLLDSIGGPVVYEVAGEFKETLKLTGKAVKHGENVIVGDIQAEGQLTPEGNLRGKWSSAIGTGGTFEGYPHDATSKKALAHDQPAQLFTRTIYLGPVTIFLDAIKRLLELIKEDFSTEREPVITYEVRGNRIIKMVSRFLADAKELETVRYLQITLQEPDTQSINRVATVELDAHGPNQIRVEGTRESWVVGKAETLAAFMRKHEKSLITNWRKVGITAFQLAILTVLFLLHEFHTFWDRFRFFAGCMVLLLLFWHAHRIWIPNATIKLGAAKPSWFQRGWDSALSWFFAVSTTLAAALLFYYLTGSKGSP